MYGGGGARIPPIPSAVPEMAECAAASACDDGAVAQWVGRWAGSAGDSC